MKYKSLISIRVGERTELDQKFAQWIEGLPDNTVLSDEIKKCCVMNIKLQEEQSEIQELKERIARQETALRGLEEKIQSGVIVKKTEGEDRKTQSNIDEEKKRQVQELAASMTDW